MDKLLYDLMDWSAVEELVYSESENPHAILGAHPVEEGVLIQVFVPTAQRIEALLSGAGGSVEMEREDENGFFACLIRGRKQVSYRLHIIYEDGREEEIDDPYAFAPLYESSDLKKFAAGNHVEIYKKMGAHPEKRGSVEGIGFSVWAPNAMRVSVVGDFNDWDGRRHQMRRLGDSGIFQLFIPGIEAGEIYKYEIKTKTREIFLKADPYAFAAELRPKTASIVTAKWDFGWEDAEWLRKRSENVKKKHGCPLSIYELNLCSWDPALSGRALAEKLAAYMKDMHYTHVELMPVMEYPLDASLGYQTTGYYALTARLGSPEDFMYFVNHLHKEGIGVILDWNAARFPKDDFALAHFDGTALYELPGGQAETEVFHFARPEVRNFLVANALFWAKQYHVDGIRVMDMSSILYFNGADGVRSNIYGGGENLDGLSFIRQLSTVMHRLCPGVLLIADGSAEYALTTKPVKENGLGFDYRWNTGWAHGFLNYMQRPERERSEHYGELTYSLLYQYSENFILPLSHAVTAEGAPSLIHRLPGENFEERFANLRAALGFFMTHPGKKLIFSGQEFGMIDEWNAERGVEWELLDYPLHRHMQDYARDLNRFYLEHAALWRQDDDPAGFEWLNCHSWEENVVAFLRKTKDEAEELLVVVNFTGKEYPKFNVGVPFHGSFRELFNSDREEYGGSGLLNMRALPAKNLEVDERDEGITIKLPAHSVVIFSCKRRAVKNTGGNAAGSEKTALSAAKRQKSGKQGAGKAVESLVKKASTAKDTAVKTASAAADTAVKTAAAARDTAVKTASAAKKSAAKTASAAKKNAVKTAAAARDSAMRTLDTLRGMEKSE
ncbi:1,4-alpha-glucan branching enzyme [Fusobacterium naviforme]|nr:1,4-alpha-glucan branching enzyme [Fusobacterium naviforme]PSL11413.1 1,4-alpha-glucan branching enzyme [Fusobacterium naviforme]STO26495.1 1,4-alpha-glucan branching enzyme GlgB [Fusobacterium naviforme]